MDKVVLQQIATQFRLLGWGAFWVQVTLAVVTFGVLMFNNLGRALTRDRIIGLGPGLSLTSLALVVLAYTTYHAFRYVKLGQRLNGDPLRRPGRVETRNFVVRGIWANVAGLLLSVMGYQALAGSLTFQASMQQPGFTGLNNTMGNNAITSLEMFSMLSNTQVLTGHVVSLLVSLWLLRILSPSTSS
ncbi:DUF3611 family protein [Synechococcus elongatus]|uniref:DUF3611 family protein n=2 Tax=Synechococcus elongatus TaxID=32046 RepID=Q31RD8_SYNE7|nr:DUF3611 family protein [Synechococcus elongatus]MBD2689283.1 DUF3611 family protein [Synechococcus elongatus FACHB-1061]ABB56381.1 conserved hypothetical protein [Synechococcus elongatus PCC 7942 = FACHB-805]AJD56570.1 hypothetical protein M744_01265 [Synechococcus elongatus UTEX 2973]MBD2588215.1 DUF3611 family protein [Synechococcus elongatus FACHB-242]MBD2707077.1 DUF3611 family protein [Synechococcus elongatus PCC 7942 = FACHB-805]